MLPISHRAAQFSQENQQHKQTHLNQSSVEESFFAKFDKLHRRYVSLIQCTLRNRKGNCLIDLGIQRGSQDSIASGRLAEWLLNRKHAVTTDSQKPTQELVAQLTSQD